MLFKVSNFYISSEMIDKYINILNFFNQNIITF